ncbi:MAG TPA: hypothetical protein VGW77_17550 [Candidatus Binatia bacterium]|jgi:hypothetical protein|nr:hypothetical protein [Candidatus Binatia bacterium]
MTRAGVIGTAMTSLVAIGSMLISNPMIFAEAAREGYLVAGAHIQFPGLGHVRADGKGYVWIPANYTLIR